MRILRVCAAALAVLALAGGCTDPPAPPSSPPASPSPLRVAPTGADGLTVRYLDTDGTIKTLPVEDFPR